MTALNYKALHTQVYASAARPVRRRTTSRRVSGAASACLGACLSVQEDLKPSAELRIEQGFEMGRPSLARLRTASHGGTEVGGNDPAVAEEPPTDDLLLAAPGADDG